MNQEMNGNYNQYYGNNNIHHDNMNNYPHQYPYFNQFGQYNNLHNIEIGILRENIHYLEQKFLDISTHITNIDKKLDSLAHNTNYRFDNLDLLIKSNKNKNKNKNKNNNNNNNNKNKNKNRNNNKNENTKYDKNDNSGIIFIDINDEDKSDKKTELKDSNDKSDSIDPFTMISMMLLGNKKKPVINNDSFNDSDTEISENYDSDDEYTEIIDQIHTIDDLIALGKKFSSGQIENKEYTEENIFMEEIVSKIIADLDDDDDKSKNKNININKKYPINVEILKKLVEPLEKLQKLVGLVDIKNSVLNMIIYYLQEFEKKSNKNLLHTVITGPPGVGKTECGKILAEIYASLGVIPSNKFTLVKRTDLIGEYLGHTAHKTQKVIDKADGGVLFIDEAYSLGNEDKKDSYSKECIDVLNQNLTEKKKKLIVIIAGYEDELEKSFFSYNPGLARRFPFRYSITGYTPNELCQIFIKKINDNKWKLTDNTNFINKFFIDKKDEFKNFGGDIENLFTMCKFSHSRRVFGLHPKNRKKLSEEDIINGFSELDKHRKKKADENYAWKSMFL
jgi:hypothetical protein